MRPSDCYGGVIDRLWALCRLWSRPLQTTTITLLLLISPIAVSQGNAAARVSDAHVYLLRGVLNVFSLGLDEIAAKLQQQGINVTVANYLSWASLADEAAA